MVLLVRFTPPLLPLKMPPPPSLLLLPVAELPEIVELVIVTVPKALAMPPPGALRRTVNKFAPGPRIVIALLINNASLVRLIGLTTLEAKVIVSPLQALAKMKRSEPGPLSLLLVTMVLPQPGSWLACTS